MRLSVGQKLLYVAYGESHEVTVGRVGRKYAYWKENNHGWEDEYRVEICDGEMAVMVRNRDVGYCYLSESHREQVKEAKELERKTSRAWDDLRSVFSRNYAHPSHLTLEQMQAMHQIMVPPPPCSPCNDSGGAK